MLLWHKQQCKRTISPCFVLSVMVSILIFILVSVDFSRGSSPGINGAYRGSSPGINGAYFGSGVAGGGGGGGISDYTHTPDFPGSYRTSSPSVLSTYAQYAAMAADSSRGQQGRPLNRSSSMISNTSSSINNSSSSSSSIIVGVNVPVVAALSMSRSLIVEEVHDEEY